MRCDVCKRKTCRCEQKREYMRRWRAENRETHNAKQRAWRSANPDSYKASKRRSLANIPGLRWATSIKRNYGITVEEYAWMLYEQDFKCAIDSNCSDRLCIDHCHATGRVRGLLCHKHNVALAALESPEFSQLQDYLAVPDA